MIRFDQLEALGMRAAILSDAADGDFGLTHATDPDAVIRSRAMLCRSIGLEPTHLTCGQQVHGTAIAVATAADRGRGATHAQDALTETDGLATAEAGLPLGILVADCVPVWLYAPRKQVCALLHAGRQGTYANIAGRGVELLHARFGADPGEIHAVIGPSAGPCCYEVSADIAADFTRVDLPVSGRFLDLWEGNAGQLRRAGLPARHIHIAGLCTICSGRFHSYRASGATQRNLAIACL